MKDTEQQFRIFYHAHGGSHMDPEETARVGWGTAGAGDHSIALFAENMSIRHKKGQAFTAGDRDGRVGDLLGRAGSGAVSLGAGL